MRRPHASCGVQVGRMLNDPDTLRQMSQVMSNPVGAALGDPWPWAAVLDSEVATGAPPATRYGREGGQVLRTTAATHLRQPLPAFPLTCLRVARCRR